MKKVFLIALLCLSICLGSVGCALTQEEEPDPISYMQETLYTAENANFRVSLTSGRSESLFVADGKVTDVKDYATLTIVPLHVDLYNDAYCYTLVGSTGTTQGTLDKDNFGASFEGAVTEWDKVGTPKTLTITYGDHSEEFTLQDRMEGYITGKEAERIAHDTIQAKLDADDHERETYVRFINDS
ncbi:MAG: hypothetical protein J5755_04125, partial [Clostridia bacterium]|nr:hypothetical protein [Clostridia bacterium]